MSASIVSKHHREDEEAKLASFRQKRLAKKLADREKLEAEFPLIFGNKQKPVVNYPSKYTTKIGTTTPGKRKVTVMNDENTENGASNNFHQAGQPTKPSNIPTSAKKAKLSSNATPSNIQPLTPSKKTTSIPVASKPARRNLLSYVFSSKPKVNEQKPTRANENIAPIYIENTILAAPQPMEKPIANPSTVEETAEIPIIPALMEETVEDKVHDVLDYLLECNELDEPTHRRLSKQSFSRTDIRRMSVSCSSKRVSFFLPTSHLVSAPTTPDGNTTTEAETMSIEAQEEAVPAEADGNEMVTDEEEQPTAGAVIDCDDIGDIDAIYEPINEECEIGDMDVLFALRNYIATLDATPVKRPLQPAAIETKEEEKTPSNTTTDCSESAKESMIGSNDNGCSSSDCEENSSENSSESDKTIASEDTVIDTHHQQSVTAEDQQPEDMPQQYVSLETAILNLSGRKSMFRRRLSTDSGMAEDNEEEDVAVPALQFVAGCGPASPLPSSCQPATTLSVTKTVSFEDSEPASTTTTASAARMTTTNTGNNTKNTVITYPRTEAIQYALSHTMVKANVIGFMETEEHHIQYMVDVVIPSALTEEGVIVPSMRMFLLKRFSEFKEFRQELCSTILPEQFMEWQYAGEAMESIPPLKTRHSSLCTKLQTDEKKVFYKGRQDLLTAWFQTILSNEKMLQNPEYRMKIQEFFSC